MNDDRRTLVGQGLAIAAPIPALEPVTSARLPSSARFIRLDWNNITLPGACGVH